MDQPITYWKDSNGHIISEDTLITDVMLGMYSGKVVVLDDYKGRGGIVPFRHPEMKMIRYDAWTEKAVVAIWDGNSGRATLAELFRQYPCICLPDLDFLEDRESTTELLLAAMLEAMPAVQFVVMGNQLTVLAPHLLEWLGDRVAYFSICRDEP